MAAAAAGGVPNPPFEFHCPLWYADIHDRVKRFAGEICLHHNICIEVERDMRLLGRQSQTQTEEEVEKEIRGKDAIELHMRNMALAKVEEEEKKKEKMMMKMNHKRCEGSIEEEEEKSVMMMNHKRCEGSIEEEDEWSIIDEEEWSIDEEGLIDEEEDCTLELPPLDTSSSFSHGFVEKWTVKMDEPYIISDLLSNRNYLVNRNGKKVTIDRLNGKYLLLYFWSLPRLHEHALFKPDPEFGGYLKEVYKLQRKYFEIVFVALGNNEDVFHETFSRMPWLAIPHKDQQARDFFIKVFAIPNPTYERAVLFAPNGTVVCDNAGPAFLSYGAHGFPFTTERIDILVSECDTLRYKIFMIKQMPSLTELLGEHLISREREKVPTSELGPKTVGLYFFEPTPAGIQRTSKLLKTWNSLTAQQRDDFKIVIINKAPFNLRYAMAVFRKNFEHTAPCWYSLEVCGLKLCRVFRKEEDSTETDEAGDLIVLKPDKYQVLSYFAFNILVEYGSDAYPFTLERAVKLTKRRQQNELVLDELLSPETPLCRGGCAHYKVDIVDTTVKKLRGKRVLLLFATHSCCESGSFLPDLKRMYEKKRMDDDFEIIYVSLDCDESPSSFPKSTQGMPWLVHPFVPHFAVVLAERLFDLFPQLPAIAAFGPDGHLETKESNLAFKNDFKSKYPFIQPDMAEEVHRELIYKYNWDLKTLVDGFF